MFKKLMMTALILALTVPVIAGDLEDGISSYTDNPISGYASLGSVDINVAFIVLHSKSKASSSNQETVVTGYDNTGNINSVVVRPGSNVYGDIIIVDQSTGDKELIISATKLFGSGFEEGSDFDLGF